MTLYIVFAAAGFLFGGFYGAAIGVLALFVIELILKLVS
jgi:hypothetical protein